jgi:hypothetical protein
MENNEIIKGNKLIAEFMGYKYYPHPAKDSGWRKEKGHLKLHGYFLCRTNKQLEYHSSWDWLMPVVEKISETYTVNIQSYPVMGFDVRFNEGTYRRAYSENESAIKAVWTAVIKFIEWYNQKNKA